MRACASSPKRIKRRASRRCASLASSGNGDVDRLLERRALAQAFEPCLQVRLRRTLERQPHPELHVAAEGNVGDGELVSGKVAALGKVALRDLQELGADLAGRLDRRG